MARSVKCAAGGVGWVVPASGSLVLEGMQRSGKLVQKLQSLFTMQFLQLVAHASVVGILTVHFVGYLAHKLYEIFPLGQSSGNLAGSLHIESKSTLQTYSRADMLFTSGLRESIDSQTS